MPSLTNSGLCLAYAVLHCSTTRLRVLLLGVWQNSMPVMQCRMGAGIGGGAFGSGGTISVTGGSVTAAGGTITAIAGGAGAGIGGGYEGAGGTIRINSPGGTSQGTATGSGGYGGRSVGPGRDGSGGSFSGPPPGEWWYGLDEDGFPIGCDTYEWFRW
ncbi:MAG: hypothetical protein MdMp014T_2047 [Treponematales bacterium]